MKDINMNMQFDNYRQIKIVKLLMDREKPMQCGELARYFRVSERMIRDDIKALKSILSPYHIDLLSKRGSGYYLDLHGEDLETIIQDSLGSLYYYDNVGVIDKFAREQLILRYLILKNKAMKPQEIMEEFFISRTTLKKDLERAKETIEHYPIKLVTIPYQGIYLEGSEVGKRMLLNRETAFYKDQSIFHMLRERIERNGINIDDLLQFVKVVCEIEISNIELYNLYSHLNIMLLRISQKQFVTMSELFIEENIKTSDFNKIKSFLDQYQDFHEIPYAEYCYFYLLVCASGYRNNANYDKEVEITRKSFLAIFEEVQNIPLTEVLLLDFAKLLKPLEIKARNHFSSSPLLVRDIKKYKPLAIELACRYAMKLDEYYQIHLFDNDICMIAHMCQKYIGEQEEPFHILVVSARGSLFTEGLLMEGLKKKLWNTIFTYCDLYDLESVNMSSYDFLISDSSLVHHAITIPVVKVNFFLYEQSISQILSLCAQCKKQKIKERLCHFISIEAKKKEDVFLWYAKYIDHRELYKEMIQREEMLTYEVDRKIAIICVFLPEHIESVVVEFPELYWKNAWITQAVIVNYHAPHHGAYGQIEDMICLLEQYSEK